MGTWEHVKLGESLQNTALESSAGVDPAKYTSK